jgi:hypothetical protein
MNRITRNTRQVVRAAVAWMVVGLMAASAFAQGLYYKEIEKDGRIYVFNIKARADSFEATGEFGVGITMLGAGPNGETIVGDSEKALQLYFFKHNIPMAIPDPPPPPPPPPPAPPWKISGLVFGDYYYFAQDHSSTWEDQHGFWFRRAYFTYDYTFSPQITTRIRLEMNSNGKLAGGSITPYVKDLYMKWTYHGRQQLTLGIHPSLTFDFIEGFWGLRHIEKTPLDLYKWDASRDTGVTFSGPLNASQTLKYSAQYGNESGNNSETDKFKAVRGTVRYETNPGFTVEAMAGHFNRAADADRTTAQVFLGYRATKGRVGFQYSFQKRRLAQPVPANSAAGDTNLDLVSGFAVFDVKKQKTSLFLRVDRFSDPCPDCAGIDYLPIDTHEPFTLTIAGLEYYLHPSVRVSPNIEYVTYGTPSSGSKPRNDAVVRFTFYWVW